MTTSRRRFLVAGAGALAAACAGGPPERAGPVEPGPPPPPPPPTGAPRGTLPPAAAPAPTTTAPAGPRFVVRGPGAPARVALTFHVDGDEDLARRTVDLLARDRTPSTCFVVGRWLDAHPSWAGRLRQGGHELANHTWSHPDSEKLAAAALQAEITRCRDLLVRLTGSPGRFFRPSGTDDGTTPPTPGILAAAAGAGYGEVAGFDVDPFDYQDPGAAKVVARTLDAVRPGSIVSLHFGHAGTVQALPAVLGGLRDRGLAPVTLGALLG